MENTVRWSLKVSRETDEALREVRARTRGLSQARLEKLVAEAIAYARALSTRGGPGVSNWSPAASRSTSSSEPHDTRKSGISSPAPP